MDRSMDWAQWEGNWKQVGDVGWLARGCQNCTQLCWPPSPRQSSCALSDTWQVSQKITVIVEDRNDNAPVFQRLPYNAIIPEVPF